MKKNKPYSRRNFIQASVVTGFGLTLSLYSCTKADAPEPEPTPTPTPPDDDTSIKITGLSIPSYMDVKKESEISIEGKGFKAGDQLIFESLTSSSKPKHVINSKTVTEDGILFKLPANVTDDGYRILVQRDTMTFILGTTVLNFVFNPNIPDKAGMTIKGVVHASGVGLANVVVSDGFEVATTDNDGIYYLSSQKKSKLVFVSIPGNYEVATKGSVPLFFNKLTKTPSAVEVKDFELTAVNNDKHVLMVLGDMHLANRNNDIQQFQQGFLRDVNNSIALHKNDGTKVYALTLGDMTWDTYWNQNNYRLPEYLREMNKIDSPVFNTMGNHDNDPSVRNDWNAENRYREVIGPTYYSFNIGKVHYIVLDNTEYLNKVGSDRGYNARIVADQLAWLKKDLATITDKSTPIVIAMHIQLNQNPGLDANGNETSGFRLMEASKFVDALNGFTKVHLLTGHTHMNYNVEKSPSIMEHNHGAVCATWWWTGRQDYAGNHICKDGSPGGYAIWEIENKDMKWAYKSIDDDIDYQFRAYDLNNIHLTKEIYAPKYTGSAWNSYAAEYVTKNVNNEVLINVWNYDSEWSVEVKENGQSLPVKRVHVRDPLHIISYSAQRLNRNAVPTGAFVTANTAHMFKVKASNATNSLEIKVTDRFGKTYTEKMIRPKTFDYSMK